MGFQVQGASGFRGAGIWRVLGLGLRGFREPDFGVFGGGSVVLWKLRGSLGSVVLAVLLDFCCEALA